jgi:hypothetical protein
MRREVPADRYDRMKRDRCAPGFAARRKPGMLARFVPPAMPATTSRP